MTTLQAPAAHPLGEAAGSAIAVQIVADGEGRRKARKAPYQNDPIVCVGFGRVVCLTEAQWEEIQAFQQLDREWQRRFADYDWPNDKVERRAPSTFAPTPGSGLDKNRC